jgi:hypothetical protein
MVRGTPGCFDRHLLWEESLIYHANFYGSVFPAYKERDRALRLAGGAGR